MVVLVTCKNEEDPIKNEGARVETTFPHKQSMGIFLDPSGQLNHSAVRGRIWSNFKSSEILWLSSLPARMKKSLPKMKALECTQHNRSIFQTFKGS